jgi:hypothetical protein
MAKRHVPYDELTPLARRRYALGLTQAALARLAHLELARYQHIDRGYRRANPQEKQRIEAVLGFR